MSYRCPLCGAETFRLREGNPLMSAMSAMDAGAEPDALVLALTGKVGVVASCSGCSWEDDVARLPDVPPDAVRRALSANAFFTNLEAPLALFKEAAERHEGDRDNNDLLLFSEPLVEYLDSAFQSMFAKPVRTVRELIDDGVIVLPDDRDDDE